MSNKFKDEYSRKRRIFTVLSIVVVLALAIWFTVFVCRWFAEFSREGFREYINSFGVWGWLVLLSLQILQVFVAFIPGELLESAAGYAFGPFVGTAVCYAGIAIGSALIFCLTRRFGVKLVEIFVSRDKINDLRFINTETKRNNLIFLIFIIPGTPKDLVTYFVGLTDIKFGSFLAISLVARIPSVLSSTFGGHLIGEEKYWGAVALYGITGVFSLTGLFIYNKMKNKKRQKAGLSEEVDYSE